MTDKESYIMGQVMKLLESRMVCDDASIRCLYQTDLLKALAVAHNKVSHIPYKEEKSYGVVKKQGFDKQAKKYLASKLSEVNTNSLLTPMTREQFGSFTLAQSKPLINPIDYYLEKITLSEEDIAENLKITVDKLHEYSALPFSEQPFDIIIKLDNMLIDQWVNES